MSARAALQPRFSALVVLLALASIACAESPPAAPNPPWRGEVVEEGDTTTVRTIEGSVWPEPAQLVEELRIGVEEGDEPYMLGDVAGIATHGDRIYVLDSSIPVVRVFSSTGEHVLDIGARGEGPGEFQRPQGIGIADERLFVRDYGTYRIAVFALDGTHLDDYPMRTGSQGMLLVVTPDGTPHSYDLAYRDTEHFALASRMVGYGPEGQVGEPLRFPLAEGELSRLPGELPCSSMSVPYSADHVVAMGSSGSLYAGYSGEYTIREMRPDGTLRIFSREIEPVPMPEEQREYARRYYLARFRYSCGPHWNWVGPDIPPTKELFERLIPTHTGELWVARRGQSVRRLVCDRDPSPSGESRPGRPCWSDELIVDAFDAEGRYLGTIDIPDDVVRSGTLPWLSHIAGDIVHVGVTDAAGVIQVRRYRLVTPER